MIDLDDFDGVMESGHISNVFTKHIGSELALDATAGAMVLTVEDAFDFSETGGELEINGEFLTYSLVDRDENLISLVDPLVTAVEAGEEVYAFPRDSAKYAQVVFDDDDEGVTAVVGTSFIDRLEEGIRDPGDEEPCYLSDTSGRWTIEHIVGVTPVMDGSYFDEDTLPSPSNPTTPPGTTPDIKSVQGTVDALIVTAGDVEVSSRIQYHISDTEGFSTGPTTLLEETRSMVYMIKKLPDGSDLLPDTTYYVRTLAVNDIGPAAGGASPEVEGRLNPDVATDLAVGEIVVGFRLQAGRIEVGEAYWDPDEGLVIPQSDGGEIKFPVDGVTAARITAHLVARSLDVEGNANLKGLTRLLGQVELSNGIPNPALAPEVSRSWDSFYPEISFDDIVGPTYIRGMCESINQATEWTVARVFFGSDIRQINKTTGDTNPFVFPSFPDFYCEGGITRLGSFYYLLGPDWSGPRNGEWYVYKLDSGYNKVDDWEIDFTFANDPVIGNDGNGLLFAFVSAQNNVLVRRYNLSFVWQGTHNLGTYKGTKTMRGVGGGEFDYGVGNGRYYLADTGTKVWVYNQSTLAYISSESFQPGGSSRIRAIAWDTTNTRFDSLANDAKLWRYTGRTVTGIIEAAYTWYDGNATGGNHETMESPHESFSWPARSKLTIQGSPAPQVGVLVGDDLANLLRMYVGTTSTVRLQGSALPLGEVALSITSLDTSSSTPPGVNGFIAVGTAPGRIYSGDANTLIDLEGDGSWDLGDLHGDTSGNVVSDLFQMGVNGRPITEVQFGYANYIVAGGAGSVTISHGMAGTPVVVLPIRGGNAGGAPYELRVHSTTSTTFDIQFRNSETGVLAINGANFDVGWIAVR